MKITSILSLSTAAVGLLAVSASAGTVNLPVFSTGSNGVTLITPGNVDPGYSVSGPLTGSTFVSTGNPGAWLPNNSTSEWIAPQVGGSHSDVPGIYTYTTDFLVPTDAFLNTGDIVLEYTGDNQVTQILLNGVLVGGPSTGGNTSYTQFSGPISITSNFLLGSNSLQFLVSNQGPTNTATGLRVWIQSATIGVVPEPSSVVGFTVAGAMLGGLLLRGRSKARNIA